MDFDRWNLDDENFSATITFGIVLFAATTIFNSYFTRRVWRE
jgi:hypothetical protein